MSAVPERRGASLAAIVLAAGTASRFGGGKVRAPLAGRPLVAHVLAAARAGGAARLVLVLGRDAAAVQAALAEDDPATLMGVLVAINPAPERGLASSLRLGMVAAAAAPAPDAVLVLLGDQPRVSPATIGALWAAALAAPPGTVAAAPAHADDGSPNPVLLLPAGWAEAARAAGDRGLGPLLAARPDLVVRVPVAGANPDVDTPADLAALERSHP